VSWSRLADDIAEVLDRLDGPVFGFGHSLGATALILAAARRPNSVRAVVAYEPVLLVGDAASGSTEAQAARSERRYARFNSLAEARTRLSARPPFDHFEPAVLEGYLRDGFISNENGEVVLVLEPDAEAALYRAGVGLAFDVELVRVRCPVSVITGEQSENAGALGAAHLLSTLPNASASSLPGRGHFGPLEDAKSTADLIRRAFATTAA
jgi:pimeloyl-ACP methyl ester carboxylesterase